MKKFFFNYFELNNSSRFVAIVLLISLFAILCGCTVFSGSIKNRADFLSSSAQEYLQKAATVEGGERQRYQLLAINQMLADDNLNDAEQLLRKFDSFKLNPEIMSQKFILNARLALQRDNPRLAIKFLHRIPNPRLLSQNEQLAYYGAAIAAHERNNDIAYSAIARMSLNQLLEDADAKYKQEQVIWHNLQTLSLAELAQLLSRSSSNLLRGWFNLAIVAKQYANKPNKLVLAIRSWQSRYPHHDANNILPTDEVLDEVSREIIPEQIALLLPLSGSFGNLGIAVRDGFMTMFYFQSKKLPQQPKIKIYDTSQSDDVVDLHQRAVDEGAQLVIGPLIKSNVDRLAKQGDIQVPTIALNYLSEDATVPKSMIFLGLSTSQSAKQIAKQAWQKGVSKILIITPATGWGEGVNQAFLDKWQDLDGSVAEFLSYDAESNLPKIIADTLNINQSKQRASELKEIIGDSFRFIPRRRQDINGIFLVANSTQARQIVPLLRFYYAGDLPLFSISSVYDGYPQRTLDQDLNGVFFNVMPWLLVKNTLSDKLKHKIKSLWHNNYMKNNRMYGLGVDAYTLSVLLPRLNMLPNFAVDGVTGQLSLHLNQQIYRQLLVAQFRQGVPVLVS